jgi:hypothetical protein
MFNSVSHFRFAEKFLVLGKSAVALSHRIKLFGAVVG